MSLYSLKLNCYSLLTFTGAFLCIFCSPSKAEIIPDSLWNKCPEELTPENLTPIGQEAIGTIFINANHTSYDGSTGVVQAEGNVEFHQDGLLVEGNHARFETKNDRGSIDNVQYQIRENHVRGSAEHVELESKTLSRYSMATYTTCPENNEVWKLKVRSLQLDTANNVGTATHVWLDFKNVPVFYLPYLTFPISGRKTGFLAPSINTSNTTGTQISVPFYWNIAPNRDATLTVNNFTDRGQQFIGQFRYLNLTNQGQIDGEFLPDDKVTGSNRVFYSFQHHYYPFSRFTSNFQYSQASDKDYFTDFGNSLGTASTTYLERKADLTYSGDFWTLSGQAVSYQTLDENILESQRPYKLLPQLSYTGAAPKDYFGMQFDIKSQYTRFERESRVSGGRLNLLPSVVLPIEGAPGYIKPKLSLAHTHYMLKNQGAGTSSDSAITLPVFSLDSTVYFERNFTLGNDTYLQTLEPRIFYLKVPYKNQSDLVVNSSDIPQVFDTQLATLNISQLFSENRFVGGDRIGDADQITLAITTRFLEQMSGIQRLTASIGQIYYFRNREVTLPGQGIDTTKRSDIIAELRAQPTSNLHINSNIQWQDKAGVKNGTFLLQYLAKHNKRLNLGYLYSKSDPNNPQQEMDLSFYWPLTTDWSVIGRRTYSFLDKRNKDLVFGLEYDSCCWAFRIGASRYIGNTEIINGVEKVTYNRRIAIELELKGLANQINYGTTIESLLEQN